MKISINLRNTQTNNCQSNSNNNTNTNTNTNNNNNDNNNEEEDKTIGKVLCGEKRKKTKGDLKKKKSSWKRRNNR